MSYPDIEDVGSPYGGVKGAFKVMKLPTVKVIGNVMSSKEIQSCKPMNIRRIV